MQKAVRCLKQSSVAWFEDRFVTASVVLASQHAGLWRRQGVAATGTRRRCRGSMHRRAIDAQAGAVWCDAWQGGAKAPCPLDRVNQQFRAQRPNQLWVSDFTHVSTWQGWLYLALVIDIFARRIVGLRVSSLMRADFMLDVLDQASYARQT